ncbi:MAG TPA: carboxypeptidase-like regulatory domain-containing protein, partial [Hymenobacter sp.]
MRNYTPPLRWLPLLLVGCPSIVQAQDAAVAFMQTPSRHTAQEGKAATRGSRSLESVLQEFKVKHNVSFFYRSELVKDKVVPANTPTFRSWEKELNYILKQGNLRVEKLRDNVYVISSGKSSDTSSQTFPSPDAVASLSSQAIQQAVVDVTIRGKVTGANNEGIPGATVVVKGTTNGASTDVAGNFSLTLPDANATLIISSIGYATQEVALAGRAEVSVTLQSDTKALDEVVVVGYGALRREDVTGSISTVKAEDIRTEGSNTL